MNHTSSLNLSENDLRPATMQLWGGIECSLVRVGDSYHDQFAIGGHYTRADADLERVASLGITALRYPISWERACPNGGDPKNGNWEWIDARMACLRRLNVRPIVTLVHHGSGPLDTCLTDEAFPEKLARFARAVAERYPWVEDYTPINEPLTTARFSGLYGHWYPHGRDERTFLQCLLGETHATVAAMQAIREITPQARLVQTEDMGKTHSTPHMAYQAQFENERRWLSLDLLCGRVVPGTRMWGHLQWVGITPDALWRVAQNPCPPDIIGLNYYLTSERFLDERSERYPAHTCGRNGRDYYADVEAVRVGEAVCAGVDGLLAEAWERYSLPLAITEAHLGCTREEQGRWIQNVWKQAQKAAACADVRAVTAWSLLGAWDWDSLLTQNRGHYEPGAWDVRAQGEPRATALVPVLQALAKNETPAHPAMNEAGWWQRSCRVLFGDCKHDNPAHQTCDVVSSRPLLLLGARGILGDALRRACELRGLLYVALERGECDITQPSTVEAALDTHEPWAVVNAAGYAQVELAQWERAECWKANVLGPATLARACARHNLPLVQFSSARVFDGYDEHETRNKVFVESDPVRPRSVYGLSKARMEYLVQERHARTLLVRSSALFGPWDGRNFLSRSLQAFATQHPVWVYADEVITPAYLPDLTHTVLDLLLDDATGVWHLAHPEPMRRADIIEQAANEAGLSSATLHRIAYENMLPVEQAVAFSRAALTSERTLPLLPNLTGAISHFAHHAARHWHQAPVLPILPLRELERLFVRDWARAEVRA